MDKKNNSKVEDILQDLEKGVEQVFDGDQYRRWLDTMSKFHHYSLNNSILICMQRPDASLVAGFTTWRDKFHRTVRKGEKGITIIAPSPYKRKQEEEVKDAEGRPVLDQDGHPLTEQREYVKQGFRIAHVFDVSQTEGEPLPELVSELTGPVEGYDDYLVVIKELSPVPIRFDKIDSGAKGYYSLSKKEIVIQRGMAEEQTIKTLLHECAHARLEHGGDEDNADRRTHEVQAESVAYCCCRALGLDTSDYSFGYIAGWSGGREQRELKESLQVIRDQADQMISGIKDGLKVVMKQREERQLQQVTPTMSVGIRM